jgi:DNA-binding XRE family transcriptional regulator
VSNTLRERRQRLGLAQQAVAVRAGVSPTLVVAIEKWGYRPTERVRERIAAAVGCSAAEVWSEEAAEVVGATVALRA